MKMDVDALLRNEKLLGRVIVTRHEFLWGLGGLKNSFYLCLVERDEPQND